MSTTCIQYYELLCQHVKASRHTAYSCTFHTSHILNRSWNQELSRKQSYISHEKQVYGWWFTIYPRTWWKRRLNYPSTKWFATPIDMVFTEKEKEEETEGGQWCCGRGAPLVRWGSWILVLSFLHSNCFRQLQTNFSPSPIMAPLHRPSLHPLNAQPPPLRLHPLPSAPNPLTDHLICEGRVKWLHIERYKGEKVKEYVSDVNVGESEQN